MHRTPAATGWCVTDTSELVENSDRQRADIRTDDSEP